MSINISNYNFDGPYSDTDQLEDKSGVYVILCLNLNNNKYAVIDIGESAEVKTRIESHDRKQCWSNNCNGEILVAVLYTLNQQQHGRMLIEQELREQYNPVCGER